jgi:hypothetical protein
VFGAVGVTSAFFQAELDTKTATWAGGYLAVPTIAAVYPSTAVSTIGGYDGVLVWTNGTDETTTANEIQQIYGADQGTTTNCSGANYSTTVLNSTTSPTTTQAFTYTDANRATTPSNINGNWYCYEIVHGWPNTTAPVWTATATTNVQIGLAPRNVPISINSGSTGNGTAGTNDTFAILFNQPVTGAGACSTNNCSAICQFHTTGTGGDTTLIGDTTCSTTSDSYTVGKITGITNGGTNNSHKKSGAKIAISGNQVTVTLGQNGTTESTGGTFTPSTSILSAATTHQATACTTGVNCTITNFSGTW